MKKLLLALLVCFSVPIAKPAPQLETCAMATVSAIVFGYSTYQVRAAKHILHYEILDTNNINTAKAQYKLHDAVGGFFFITLVASVWHIISNR